MATPIKMPSLGTTVEEVKLVSWLKQVGDPVARGEAICEVETDKATMELESYAAGVLLAQTVPAGTDVEEGQIVAYVGKAGEEVPVEQAPPDSQQQAVPTPETSAAPASKVKVSPLIRNLARREGVDLSAVAGSGPGGRITREDVLKAKDAGASAPAGAERPLSVPLTRNQRGVARRISKSHREIVTIHLTGRIDMSGVIRLREKLRAETGGKISYDAILLHAIAKVIRNFPRFLSRLEGETVVASEECNLALAVSIDDELYIPTVAAPQDKTIPQIEADVRSLVEKAREGELAITEMSGASLTVSNLGMYPVSAFTMVIPPGQSAALAVGAIEETPIVRDGQLTSAPLASVTLAVDHRLINGRQAAEFLTALKEFLETL